MKRMPPVGFVTDAQHMTVTKLREKYAAGQETVKAWLDLAGIPPRVAERKPRATTPPATSATYPCGHPRTHENTVGIRKLSCRKCQHEYKARRKAAEKLTATPVYDRAVSEKAVREGTDKLLAAIWREHPQILRNAAARGRYVEAPKGLAA